MDYQDQRRDFRILLALILFVASVFFFGWLMTLQPPDSAPTFRPQKPVFNGP